MTKILFSSLPDLIALVHQLLKTSTSNNLSDIYLYQLDKLCKLIDKTSSSSDLTLAQGFLYAHLREWKKAADSIDKALKSYKDDYAKAACYYAKGKLYEWQGLHQQTLPEMEQSILLAGHNRILRAYALIASGWSHYYMHNFGQARAFFEQALGTRVEEVKGECWRSLGAVAYRTGRFDESQKLLKQAYDVSQKDEVRLMKCENDLGNLALYKEDYEIALSHYRKCETQAAILRDVDRLARAQTNIAETYLRQKKYEKALEYYKLALRLSPFINRRAEVIERFRNGSSIQRQYAMRLRDDHGKPAEATQMYIRANTSIEQGLEMAEASGNYRLMADLWFNRATIERDQGHIFAALQALDHSQKMIRKIPVSERSERDISDMEAILEHQSQILTRMIDYSRTGKIEDLHGMLDWQETSVVSDRIEVEPVLYSEYLYQELLLKLQNVQIEKGRLATEPLAQMLATLKGARFKNLHYTFLGYAWTTATLHLRQLTEKGVLEKTGHAKGAYYRLHRDFCSLLDEQI